MFTIKLDGEDLVLAQDDREVMRRSIRLDDGVEHAHQAATEVSHALAIALNALVVQAWRARLLDRTDGFHR
jgi:hypothetical protein